MSARVGYRAPRSISFLMVMRGVECGRGPKRWSMNFFKSVAVSFLKFTPLQLKQAGNATKFSSRPVIS